MTLGTILIVVLILILLGVLQLSGFVSSQADINKAGEIARDVPGVKSVTNDMRVK
jgi:osmotically-inducible protein OsmY